MKYIFSLSILLLCSCTQEFVCTVHGFVVNDQKKAYELSVVIEDDKSRDTTITVTTDKNNEFLFQYTFRNVDAKKITFFNSGNVVGVFKTTLDSKRGVVITDDRGIEYRTFDSMKEGKAYLSNLRIYL